MVWWHHCETSAGTTPAEAVRRAMRQPYSKEIPMRTSNPVHLPHSMNLPYYMTAMDMQCARFVEGNNGAGGTGTATSTDSNSGTGNNAATSPAGDGNNGDGDEVLGEPGKKALDSERARAKKLEKQLAEANKKIQDAEDAKLSELDREKKRAADAETRAAALEKENLRFKALAGKNIPEKYHSLVQGETADELEASAALVAELHGSHQAGNTGNNGDGGSGTPSKPKVDPIPGSGTGDGETNPNSVDAGKALHQQRHGKK